MRLLSATRSIWLETQAWWLPHGQNWQVFTWPAGAQRHCPVTPTSFLRSLTQQSEIRSERVVKLLMGDRSAISWTEATWNPVTGCDKVSPGCDHCYAETIAHRFAGTPAYPNGFALTLHPKRLEQPLRWRRPRMIFVNSMSDLFHPQISDGYLDQVFDVMEIAGHHTFQILTKRHARMRNYLRARVDRLGVASMPAHIWVGVSVESQKWADLRIPALLQTPVRVRFLSCEPLLDRVRLCQCDGAAYETHRHPFLINDRCSLHGPDRVGWVIVGGESGPGARRMDVQWARDLRNECAATGVAFFAKQAGSVLARDWGITGKGEHVDQWPETFPQQYPALAAESRP